VSCRRRKPDHPDHSPRRSQHGQCGVVRFSAPDALDNLAPLAKAGIPILHVCGQLDPWLDRETRVAEKRYKEFGGQMTVILKPGEGHFPIGPQDPAPVVDFIVAKSK
jgi:pimeloyl-ACP methyl ester carboxylesterase